MKVGSIAVAYAVGRMKCALNTRYYPVNRKYFPSYKFLAQPPFVIADPCPSMATVILGSGIIGVSHGILSFLAPFIQCQHHTDLPGRSHGFSLPKRFWLFRRLSRERLVLACVSFARRIELPDCIGSWRRSLMAGRVGGSVSLQR